MAKKPPTKKQQEVVLQIPDLGLTDAQIDSLKKSFKNELVSSMKDKAVTPGIIIVIVIRVRIVRELAE